MHNKNVTFIIGHLWQGGGERVCTNLANEIVKTGVEVNLIVVSLDNAVFYRELDHRVNVVILEDRPGKSLLFKIYSVIKDKDLRLIISFNYNLSFYLSLIKKIRRFVLISRSLNTLSEEFKSRTSSAKRLKNKLVVYGLKHSNIVVSQSSGMEIDLVNLGVPRDKIKVINNPVSVRYLDIEERDENSEEYILFVGRLATQKGLCYLLESMKYVDTRVKLKIIGEGPLRAELENLASLNGVADKVEFLGARGDMKEYYINAKCTVLSSLYEGFPNVLIESLSCGTPVVSFDCPNGPREIIIPGVNGYLVKYKDVHDLAFNINRAVSGCFDDSQVRRTAINYAPESIAKKYLELCFGEK